MDIVDALGAATGTTCVVGAGGKKTTMATLGGRLDRAVVTATVRIPIFDEWAGRVVITEEPVRTVGDALERSDADEWPLGVVPEQEREDRYRGYDPETIDRVAEFDVPILVKADGARMRRFKAPDDHEPRLPATADTGVPSGSSPCATVSITSVLVTIPTSVVGTKSALMPSPRIRLAASATLASGLIVTSGVDIASRTGVEPSGIRVPTRARGFAFSSAVSRATPATPGSASALGSGGP